MTAIDERAALRAEILAIEPGLAPLNRSTTAQLRALLADMKAQRAAYAAAGLVDETAEG